MDLYINGVWAAIATSLYTFYDNFSLNVQCETFFSALRYAKTCINEKWFKIKEGMKRSRRLNNFMPNTSLNLIQINEKYKNVKNAKIKNISRSTFL